MISPENGLLEIRINALTQEAFAPFGDVIELGTVVPTRINQGLCQRFTDLAQLDFAEGRAGISLFNAELRSLPFTLEMLERHPLGSQCFLPMESSEYLVIVAADEGGKPAKPEAFFAEGWQGINLHRNVWHGVLTPLSGSGLFAVVDRIGSGNNLQEYWLKQPYLVVR